MMRFALYHLDETDSTNRWLKEHGGEEDMVVWADYQTSGHGCGTNSWEGERGKNLLFSILLHPKHEMGGQLRDSEDNVPTLVRMNEAQFQLSMAISLAITEAVGNVMGDLSIKWPNDIYWRNFKLGGILIEHTLQGGRIKNSIIGVGLNVNQTVFTSGAPNPVSMKQVCEHNFDREQLLRDILDAFERFVKDPSKLKVWYMSKLYRQKGYHPYTDSDGVFMARIENVTDDGRLVLNDDNGRERRYAFKEVQFVI